MRSFNSRTVVALAAVAVSVALLPGYARADAINIGAAFGPVVQPFIDTIVQGLIALLIGVVAWAAQKYLNIKFEGANRDALTAWLQRQAQSLVADGMVRLNGVQVTVDSPALAAIVNTASTHIPDALKFFGLTSAQLGQMVIDHIPAVPSVAAAQAVALDVANPATPSTAKSSA